MRIATFLITCSLCIAPLFAEESHEHQKLARDISELAIVITSPEEAVNQATSKYAEEVSRNANLSKEEKARFKAVFEEVAKEYNRAYFVEALADSYSSIFTTEELKGILEFYKTEAGKALLSKRTRLDQLFQNNVKASSNNAAAKVTELLKEREPAIMKKLVDAKGREHAGAEKK